MQLQVLNARDYACMLHEMPKLEEATSAGPPPQLAADRERSCGWPAQGSGAIRHVLRCNHAGDDADAASC